MSLKDEAIVVTAAAEAWVSGLSRPWWTRAPKPGDSKVGAESDLRRCHP